MEETMRFLPDKPVHVNDTPAFAPELSANRHGISFFSCLSLPAGRHCSFAGHRDGAAEKEGKIIPQVSLHFSAAVL